MYKVGNQEFSSFLKAVAVAKVESKEVIEAETNVRRWTPAPKVDAKRMRRYSEQKAAYEAQQK